MANQTPDIRILVGNRGGASASGESAVLIRSNLEKALSAGIKIKVDVDKSQLGQLKKQLQGVTPDIKIGVGTSRGGGAGTLSTDKGAIALVKLSKAFADAELRLSQFNSYLQTVNPKGLKEYAVQIAAIRDGFSSRDPLRIKAAAAGMNELKAAFKTAGYEGGNAFTYLESKIKTFATYLASSALTMGVVTGARNVINTVKELDGSLTDLRVVTGGTREETQRLLTTYNQMAQELGSTTKDIAGGAASWLRQGYSLSDANELIEASTVFSKVGFMDADESAKALTSTLKGFRLEVSEVMRVADALSALDLDLATTAGDIATALAQCASSADMAGISLEKAAAQIGVVLDVTQGSGEEIGNFYKTFMARLGNIKAGRLEDPETGESLSDVETVLNSMGIKLRDSESKFRNFGDVLDEVGAKWKNLSSVQQQALAVAMSGTRMQNKFKALMENYQKSLDEERIALNSSGTAMQKFSVYEESVEAKTQRMTAAFENFASVLLDSGWVKGALDFGTGLLEDAAAADGLFVKLPLVATAIFGVVTAVNALRASSIGEAVERTLAILPNFIKTMNATGVAMQSIKLIQDGATVSTKNLAVAFSVLTPAQIANLAVSNKLSEAELKELLRKKGLSKEKKKEILQHYNSAVAKGADKLATDSLNISMKNLWATTKAFLATPMGWLTVAAIAIPIIVALYDKLNVTTEEHIERLKELEGQYDTVTSDLENAEQELANIAKRMQELQDIQSPTLMEQEELRRLTAANIELERNILLLKQQKAELEEEKSSEAKAAWASMNEAHGSGRLIYTPVYDDSGAVEDYSHRVVSDVEYAAYAMEQLRQAEAELLSMSAEEIAADGGARYDILEKKIAGYKDELGEIRDLAAGAGTEDALQLVDAILYAMGNAEDKSAVFSNKLKELEINGHKSFSALASGTEVTAENLEELVGTDTAEELNAISGSAEQTAIELNALANAAERPAEIANTLAEKLYSLEEESASLTGAMDALAGGTLDSFLTADGGKNLDALLKKFPDLQDELTAYADGLITAEQMQSAFNAALIDFDSDRIYDGINDIVSACEDYGPESNRVLQAVQNLDAIIPGLTEILYDQKTGLLLVDESALSGASSLYEFANGAIEAARSAARAEFTSFQDRLKQVKDLAWETLYPLELMGSLPLNTGTDFLWGQKFKSEEELDAYYDGIAQRLEGAKNRFNNAASKKSGSSVDLYIADIDKLYESSKRLKDIKNNLDTLDEKSGQLGTDEYARKNGYLRETIGLYQQENELLNEQNNIRRQIVQDGVDKLRGQGFLVDYDPASNDLLIRNMERINELYGENKKSTNEIRKAAEDLIGDIEKLNDDAAAASFDWYKNLSEINSRVVELSANIKAASDEWTNDLEHNIDLMKNQGVKEDKIVSVYESMMSYVHGKAEEIRAVMREEGKTADEIEASDEIQALQDQWWNYHNAVKDIRAEQLDDLNEIVDLTRDMIKQEKEDQIDALNEQIDKFGEIISLKKESIDLTERERSYSENVGDKTKDISKLQARIDALALDDSRSAQAERGALLEELAEKQRELDDLQREHSIDSQKDALDREQKDFEDAKGAEIEEIRKFLGDNEAMTKAALNRIDNLNANTFDDLLRYSRHYTDTTGAELETMWDNAIDAAKRYGSVTNSLTGLEKESGGDWNDPHATNPAVAHLVDTMQSNSVKWASSSVRDRERLEEENNSIAEEIGQLIGQEIVRGHDGKWYIGSENGKLLYDVYHGGTPSAGAMPTPKQNELWALMEKREMVLTPEHQNNLFGFLSSLVPKVDMSGAVSSISNIGQMFENMKHGREINIDNRMYIDGCVPDDQVISAIERQRRKAAEILSEAFGL